MRPSNKRSRSKQNRPRSLGNVVNRVFDSSGPEGKVRGTPQQIIDKYALLARDAQLSGDRVAAENFLQHAEHYTRMLNEAQAEMAREAEQRRDQFPQGGQNNGQQNNGQQNNNNQNNQNNQSGNAGQQNNPQPQNRRSDEGGEGEQPRPNWKQERNRRFEERRQSRESGESSDPRDEDSRQDTPAEPESMLIETPESRGTPQPAAQPATGGDPAPAPEAEAAPRRPRARTRKPKTPPEPTPDAAAE